MQVFPWAPYWSPLGPYNKITRTILEPITSRSLRFSHNAKLVSQPNEIHLVLDISSSLKLFNQVKLISSIKTYWHEMVMT